MFALDEPVVGKKEIKYIAKTINKIAESLV